MTNYVNKMVKARRPYMLLKKAATAGYTSDGKKHVCPVCKEKFMKHASSAARKNVEFYKKMLYNVLVFVKPGAPQYAACHCGFRRVPSTKAGEQDGRCKAVTKKGKRCRYMAKENGLCGVHQNATTPDPQVGHHTARY